MKMLDLEINPEKSISSEKWQILLGKLFYRKLPFSPTTILPKIKKRNVNFSSCSNFKIKLRHN